MSLRDEECIPVVPGLGVSICRIPPLSHEFRWLIGQIRSSDTAELQDIPCQIGLTRGRYYADKMGMHRLVIDMV